MGVAGLNAGGRGRHDVLLIRRSPGRRYRGSSRVRRRLCCLWCSVFLGSFCLVSCGASAATPSKHRCRCVSRVAPLAVQLKSGVLRLYETMTMRGDRCAPLASAKGLWIANLCYGNLCLAPLQEGYRFRAMGTLRRF